MILLDSSCWISYFLGDPCAENIEGHLQRPESCLVPTLVVYEVFRQLLKKIEEKRAVHLIAQMDEGTSVSLDQNLALYAAQLGLEHNLGTADAVIYATALAHNAKLVTLDNDFRNLPHCVVIA